MNKKYLIPILLLTLCVVPAFAVTEFQIVPDAFENTTRWTNDPVVVYDNNISTTTTRDNSGLAQIWLNYTKPDGIVNETLSYFALWTVQYGDHNSTLDSTCYDVDGVVMIRLQDDNDEGNTYYTHCYNGTDWIQLDNLGDGASLEETGFYWDYEPVEEEAGFMQTILTDIGTGTGAFIEAITEPVSDFILALGIIAGTLIIIYGFGSLIKFKGAKK